MKVADYIRQADTFQLAVFLSLVHDRKAGPDSFDPVRWYDWLNKHENPFADYHFPGLERYLRDVRQKTSQPDIQHVGYTPEQMGYDK